MITIWSGTLVSIPAGWALCNGTQGTPDLRNRFIVCYGDTYSVGDRGGSDSHLHVVNIDPHVHVIGFGGTLDNSSPRTARARTDSQGTTGETNTVLGRKPYYAFAYIMKL